jgi:drug/metabolite transporter (DMT)-like permease
MLWILFAIIGACANAAYFIIIKQYITVLDPKLLTGIGFTLGGCMLFLLSAYRGFPSLGPGFFSAVSVTVILNIIGLGLIVKALSSSDLSLSVPMLSFTPAILIGTSYILLHEVPSFFGFLGICIIVSGSYVLNISAEHNHFFDPIRSMIRNRSSWYMVIVAFLFAVSINYDKIVLLNSDPFFGMALTVFIIGIAFLAVSGYSWYTGRKGLLHRSLRNPGKAGSLDSLLPHRQFAGLAILIGMFVAVEAASINIAYTLQIVPYVIAIKRMSIILMVLYGTFVFSEKETGKRILGASIMVAGAVIILLFA